MSIFPYFYLSIYASIPVPYICICLISNNNLRGDEVRIDKNILSKGKRVRHRLMTHPLLLLGVVTSLRGLRACLGSREQWFR